MKTIHIFAMLFLMVSTFGCRDTKKEQEEVEQAIKAIDSVEATIETSAELIDAQAEEAMEAVKELDSI